MRILAYPTEPESLRDGLLYLKDRIAQSLLRQRVPPLFTSEYTSGRRTYTCRSFSLLNQTNGVIRPAIAVLLERRFTGINPLISQFNLTTREGEVVELLGWGLTTKEIAQRMKISGSTVNSFVRIVMIKMGVSTRSGIVGKVWQNQAASRV
jgi:DNA-binding CsgD family transcriptional regulator